MLGLVQRTVISLHTWAVALVAATTTMFPGAGLPATEAWTQVATTTATAIGTTGTTGGTTGTNAPAGPFSNAPTENLFRVASHLSLRHKSVTTVVSITAGLGISNPVEISILFGTQRITQNYNVTSGNRFLVDFDALDGAIRRENVTITLRDDTPTGPKTYALLWYVDLEPLFDLTIGPLGFIALSACDLLSPADPVISWWDPERFLHEVQLDGDAGRVTAGFAGTWPEVGISRGLTIPSLTWFDRDLPALPDLLTDRPPPPDQAVLPGLSHHVRMVLDGGDCDGRFDFDVTLSLRHYERL